MNLTVRKLVRRLRLNGLFATSDRLRAIEQKIDKLEYYSNGSRGTYIGNNRVVVKSVIRGQNIAYIVPADDKLITPWFIITGGYETLVTDYLVANLKSDSRCLDIGANFGYFSCLMARFCPEGRVIGVEADHEIFAFTRDNLMANGFTQNASAVHAAVGASDAPLTLYRRRTRPGNTSIIAVGSDFTDLMGEPPAEPFEVASMRIDDLVQRLDDRVDFIKIDIEGAEPLALQGAKATIERNPGLQIIMEWSPGQIAHAGFDVRGFLAEIEGMGLSFFDIEGAQSVPISADDLMRSTYKAAIVIKRPDRLIA